LEAGRFGGPALGGGRYTLESLEASNRSDAMIEITDKGAEKVHEFLASQQADVSVAGLRVGVRGGGCSGFQYQLAFDEQRDSDLVFESHGLKLLVDHESLQFVSGSTIDYEESLQGAGFKVNNPNVVAACGCGSSFRVAEEERVSAV
jgi:iron-sulfur cluster assembly protein